MMSALTPSDLQRIFEKLDKNGDGFVGLESLNKLLETVGFQFGTEEVESLVGKTRLDFNEFLSFYESISKNKRNCSSNEESKEEEEEEEEEVERDLVKAFSVFDMDGDGFISSQELECVLRRLGLWDDKKGTDCRSMICAYDTNLDGLLDFQEFKNMMLLTIP